MVIVCLITLSHNLSLHVALYKKTEHEQYPGILKFPLFKNDYYYYIIIEVAN